MNQSTQKLTPQSPGDYLAQSIRLAYHYNGFHGLFPSISPNPTDIRFDEVLDIGNAKSIPLPGFKSWAVELRDDPQLSESFKAALFAKLEEQMRTDATGIFVNDEFKDLSDIVEGKIRLEATDKVTYAPHAYKDIPK